MPNEKFTMPMSGKLLALGQVPDTTFSDKTLGDGFAVELEGEVVISPLTGVVIAAFPSGHAFIIRREDGLEVLIHIGLNSAGKAQAFRPQVQKYDQVEQGDVLVYVDKQQLADSENALISPIVFANPNIEITLHKEGQRVIVGETDSVSIQL